MMTIPSGDPVEGPPSRPLSEMVVVDISQQLPGPYASALLGQLGASVIKVEPHHGDPSRVLDPQMFALVNAGKDLVHLDLKAPSDVGDLHDLVAGADVFIEGFRPGVAERLGASWPILCDLNPRLVYCSISASGQHGPFNRIPMHDLNLQGLAGLEPEDGIGVPWVDLGTATLAALAIVARWHVATETGQGCYLDAAMLDTAVLWGRVKESAHGRVEPTYGIFPTADGFRIAVAILEDHIWIRLCEALRWDDWLERPDLATYAGRIASATAIRDRLAATCLDMAVDHLLELAKRHDLPLTPAGKTLIPGASEQLAMRGLDPGSDRRVPIPFSQDRSTRRQASAS